MSALGKGRNGTFYLTDTLIDQISSTIEGGNYLRVACAAAGVPENTYNRWMQRGRATLEANPNLDTDADVLPADVSVEDLLCAKLVERMAIAEAKSEAYAVLVVRKQMPDQWQAAMTYLERRFPKRWRRHTANEHTGTVMVDSLDEDALLEDPNAVELLHDALSIVARGGRQEASDKDAHPRAIDESVNTGVRAPAPRRELEAGGQELDDDLKA